MELHEVYKVTVPVKAHLTCRPDNGPYYPTDRVEAPRVRDRCGDGAGPRVSSVEWSKTKINSISSATQHTSELVVRIILFMSHFSIFDTRYIFGLANQG